MTPIHFDFQLVSSARFVVWGDEMKGANFVNFCVAFDSIGDNESSLVKKLRVKIIGDQEALLYGILCQFERILKL